MTYGTSITITNLRHTAKYVTSEKVEEGYFRRYLNDVRPIIILVLFIVRKLF